MLIILLFLFNSCNYPTTTSNLCYDFLKNFNKAEIFPSKEKVVRYQSWQKATEGRDAMVIGVFGGASFKLEPHETGDDLYFGLRLRVPDTASAKCCVVIQTSDKIDTVFTRFLDAKFRAEDRNWSDYQVNLSNYKNIPVKVTFIVLFTGTDAWVEWSSPILLEHK